MASLSRHTPPACTRVRKSVSNHVSVPHGDVQVALCEQCTAFQEHEPCNTHMPRVPMLTTAASHHAVSSVGCVCMPQASYYGSEMYAVLAESATEARQLVEQVRSAVRVCGSQGQLPGTADRLGFADSLVCQLVSCSVQLAVSTNALLLKHGGCSCWCVWQSEAVHGSTDRCQWRAWQLIGRHAAGIGSTAAQQQASQCLYNMLRPSWCSDYTRARGQGRGY